MTSKNALLKVVIIGDGAVGKSCLMHRYVNNRFDESSFHTIGVEFLNKEIDIDGQTFILQIWDTAGQERFKSLRTPFYRGSDICMLVFSVGDRESFRNVAKWKEEFVHYADIKNPLNFPFVILGNKVDLPLEEREVSIEESASWCQDNGNLPYIETSAKDSTNVENAFIMAVRVWDSLDEKQEKLYNSNTVSLTGMDETSKRMSCCTSTKSTTEFPAS